MKNGHLKMFVTAFLLAWLGTGPIALADGDAHAGHGAMKKKTIAMQTCPANNNEHSHTGHDMQCDNGMAGMDHSAHDMKNKDHAMAAMDHSGHDMQKSDAAMAAMDHSAHEAMLDESGFTRDLVSYSIPDVTLYDQHGDAVSLPALIDEDEPVLLNFIYTTCVTICPVLSASFSDVQEALGEDAEDIRMVSISIDPEHDSPEVLQSYASRYNAGENWDFLTGDLPDVVNVLKSFDAYRRDKMNHIPLTFIRVSNDADWTRLQGFPGVEDVVSEIRQLKMHAMH